MVLVVGIINLNFNHIYRYVPNYFGWQIVQLVSAQIQILQLAEFQKRTRREFSYEVIGQIKCTQFLQREYIERINILSKQAINRLKLTGI